MAGRLPLVLHSTPHRPRPAPTAAADAAHMRVGPNRRCTGPDGSSTGLPARTTSLEGFGRLGFELALGTALLAGCTSQTGRAPEPSPVPGVGVAAPVHAPPAVTAEAAAPSRAAREAYPHGRASTPNAAAATKTAAAHATPTPLPTEWPTKPPPRSRLLVDGPTGRIFASRRDGARSELLVYDARDGRLAARRSLEPNEVLLDIDRAGRRLYLYRADRGVRLLSLGDLVPVGAVALPTPDPSDAVQGYIIMGPIDCLAPLVDPVTGEILTIHGRTVSVHDSVTGRPVREIDVPLRPESGPIYRAALSDDGQILYLAVADSELADWTDQPGTVLLALDTATGEVLGRSEARALVSAWLAWGRSLFASTDVYKDIGSRHYLWIDGRVRRQVFEANVAWTAHDSRRNRLVRVTAGNDGYILVGADASTLDTVALESRPAPDSRRIGLAGGDISLFGPPIAYDAVTDQLYAWSDEADRLVVIGASAIDPTPRVGETPVASERLSRFLVLSAPADASSGELPEFVAMAQVTPGAGTPTPEWGPELPLPVIRRSGKSELSAYSVPWSGSWWGWRPVPSPDYARDRTLFHAGRGFGVLRSTDAGRSWAPAGGGLDHLAVQQVVVSPHYAADRTVLAVTFLGIQSECVPEAGIAGDTPADDARSQTRRAPSLWRSRDGGGRWVPIGRFAAPAFAPDFASDRTMMAFGYLDGLFHVSHDGGGSWEARGRLSESSGVVGTRLWIVPATEDHRRVLVAHGNGGSQQGGVPHWPESWAAIHVSIDDGWTWREAWPESDQGVVVALESELVGPLPGAAGRLSTWLLRLEDDIVLRSSDGGVHWQQVHLREDPGAYPLAALPDGLVLTAPGEPGLPRAIAPDAFEVGAPPTPRPGE